MTTFVVGLDGGGTKTHAIVADEHGTQLGEFSGPASAVRPGHVAYSADVVAAVVREAMAAANLGDAIPRMLCAGVAGVGRDSVRQEFWHGGRSTEALLRRPLR